MAISWNHASPLAEFIRHLSSEGIPATLGKAREVKDDLEILRKWHRSS
jgi:hypothetical protein